MRSVTELLFVFLVIALCSANDYEELQIKIKNDPELKNVLIENLAKTIGKSLFSEKIDVRGSLLESVQRSMVNRPFGLEFSVEDIIRILLLAFRYAPVPSDGSMPSKYFASNGDMSLILTLLRALKKVLSGKQRQRKTVDKSLIVQTTEGKLQGVRLKEYGVKFIGYFNIPYATLHRRFQAPKPPKPWKGIRSAEDELSFCAQKLLVFDQTAGTEDCLHLSVMVPTKRVKMTPVFVWIHGGSFRLGTGTTYATHPEKLLKQGQIVVSIHYRLGALGFLSTGTKDAPGNAGLKDVVAALKWLKANIANFGGDPENITLYGLSSGGIIVEYLSLSKMARGLFSKAIIGSGSVFNSWAYSNDPLKQAFRLGRNLGFNGTNVEDLVKFLKKVNPLQIVEEQEKIFLNHNPSGEFLPFVPCTEVKIPGVEPFLADLPEKIIKSGDYYKVPTIYSFNEQEGLFMISLKTDPKQIENVERNLEYFLPVDLLDGLLDPQHKRDILNKIRQFYFNGEKITRKQLKGVVELLGDSKFLLGVFKSVRLRLETTSVPTYLNEFAFDGDLNSYKYNNDVELKGVAHVDEQGYLFRLPLQDLYNQNNKTSQLVAKRYVTMYANFVKYGNPTPKPSRLLPVNWYPVQSAETFDYLEITDQLKMKQNPFKARREFWNNLYKYKRYLLMLETKSYYK